MSKVAERLAECFEYNADAKRVVFAQTTGGDYETLSALIHKLEVDEDMAYDEVQTALEAIADRGLDEIEDYYYEYCGADIYTYDLLEWVSKNPNNVAWCDQATSERPDALLGLVDTIRDGQAMAKESVWRATIDLVRKLGEGE